MGKSVENVKLQWHPGFYAALKPEMGQEWKRLLFENEHQLGTKPKEIDVLITKKNGVYSVRKNIGRIFRRHNIIEYKNPAESLSVNDYFEVYGYACFYIGDAEHVMQIDPNEVTITFICNQYPRGMLKYLKERYGVEAYRAEPGIYYLKGSRFPVQIIINHELDPKENLWLYSLRSGLNREEIKAIIADYEKHKDSRAYQSAMDLITRANWEIMKEVKKMCDALKELFADELKECEKRVMDRTISNFINAHLAEGSTEEQITEMLVKFFTLDIQQAVRYMSAFK